MLQSHKEEERREEIKRRKKGATLLQWVYLTTL
jgi:hypothetical protein